MQIIDKVGMLVWVIILIRVYFRQFFRISTKARHNSGNPAEIFKLRLRGLSREFCLFKRTRMRRRYWWAIAVSFSESFLKSIFVPRNNWKFKLSMTLHVRQSVDLSQFPKRVGSYTPIGAFVTLYVSLSYQKNAELKFWWPAFKLDLRKNN